MQYHRLLSKGEPFPVTSESNICLGHDKRNTYLIKWGEHGDCNCEKSNFNYFRKNLTIRLFLARSSLPAAEDSVRNVLFFSKRSSTFFSMFSSCAMTHFFFKERNSFRKESMKKKKIKKKRKEEKKREKNSRFGEEMQKSGN